MRHLLLKIRSYLHWAMPVWHLPFIHVIPEHPDVCFPRMPHRRRQIVLNSEILLSPQDLQQCMISSMTQVGRFILQYVLLLDVLGEHQYHM